MIAVGGDGNIQSCGRGGHGPDRGPFLGSTAGGKKKHLTDDWCNDSCIRSRCEENRSNNSSPDCSNDGGGNSSLGHSGEKIVDNRRIQWLRIEIIECAMVGCGVRMQSKLEGPVGDGGIICHSEGTCSWEKWTRTNNG